MKGLLKDTKNAKPGSGSLYKLLDFFQLRAPILPTEFYLELTQQLGPSGAKAASDSDLGKNGTESSCPKSVSGEMWSLANDELIRAALAAGSLDLLDALERGPKSPSSWERVQSRLQRYLIRMSTRPTPFGLFAGVAMGRWADATDLRIGAPLRTRTRPDMQWLMRLVWNLESRPEVRQQLSVFANPAAFAHSGRVFLAESATPTNSRPPRAVSVRNTAAVRHILSAAREPIPWNALAKEILSEAAAATSAKVEKLLTELWEQSLLLSDLRPPLTHSDPARYVAERLDCIQGVQEDRDTLKSVLEMMRAWDASEVARSADGYRRMVASAIPVRGSDRRSTIQVDTALTLAANRLSRTVGEEVARAAELLMRISPWPDGPTYLNEYRHAFQSRYGNREVPILELLDPSAGLGPPPTYSQPWNQPVSRVPRKPSAAASQALLDLAFRAVREGRPSVQLDEEFLSLLQTSHPGPANIPSSLDIYALIAAASAESIDRGDFKVALGPNLGASAAGRNLGRFADLIGDDAREALKQAAEAEEALRPGDIWAELAYLPHRVRSANVVVRPPVRRYEVAWGVTSGVDFAHAIPVNELVVGVRDGRFFLRWPPSLSDVTICMGHMLNYTRAPAVCRFLADIGRDRLVQLSGFSWGPASHFPFLPRVEYGRLVLRPAQWTIQASTLAGEFLPNKGRNFSDAFVRWRSIWNVPRFVYLSAMDNRLLLDLDNPIHAGELRQTAKAIRTGDRLVLEEVFPSLEEAWVRGDTGHYMAEVVVSLVRRSPKAVAKTKSRPVQTQSRIQPVNAITAERPHHRATPPEHRVGQALRPPGSEWLFVKLYCNAKTIEDLVAYTIRDFAARVSTGSVCDAWFFLRYSDPDSHVRIRFTGEPARLANELIPRVCEWATGLMANGKCLRFSFDTYEKEVGRYGGVEGVAVAESVFCHDSWAVAELLYLAKSIPLKLDRNMMVLLSLDALLEGLGLDSVSRFEWCRSQCSSRKEGSRDFQSRKAALRGLLGSPTRLQEEPGGKELARVLTIFKERLRAPSIDLHALDVGQKLDRPLDSLNASFVHMHLNRFGFSGPAEKNIVGLLWRIRQSLFHTPEL